VERPVLHVSILAFLVASLGPLALSLKPIPGALLVAPFAGHAACAALGARRARASLAGAIFWVAMALASTVGAYALFVLVSPPVTSDGHPVMPMGQAFGAGIFGPLVGGLLAYAYGKTVRGERRERDWVLHALGVALLAAFVWKNTR